MNAIFKWAPLFTVEKFNKHPDLGAHFEICNVCRGAQIFFAFYNKQIYKQIFSLENYILTSTYFAFF